MGFGMPYPGNPFFPAGPGMVTMPTTTTATRPESRSPPSSPPSANYIAAEFCELYNLGEQAAIGLEKLGFCFGDNLDAIKSEEFAKVGFKLLDWKRLLKAYKKAKRENRS